MSRGGSRRWFLRCWDLGTTGGARSLGDGAGRGRIAAVFGAGCAASARSSAAVIRALPFGVKQQNGDASPLLVRERDSNPHVFQHWHETGASTNSATSHTGEPSAGAQ